MSAPSITATGWDDPDAVRLRTEQRAELDERYGFDGEPGVKPSAGDIVLFLVARTETGEAVGCGALRELGDGVAEIKRMYVVPEHRGTGVSTAVLRELEQHARERGIRRLLLETGTRQPDAIRFYEREGYRAVPLFGAYIDSPISLCFGREL